MNSTTSFHVDISMCKPGAGLPKGRASHSFGTRRRAPPGYLCDVILAMFIVYNLALLSCMMLSVSTPMASSRRSESSLTVSERGLRLASTWYWSFPNKSAAPPLPSLAGGLPNVVCSAGLKIQTVVNLPPQKQLKTFDLKEVLFQ